MRLVHRKLRTGCRQCRRRKIKCDEAKPSCANCKKQSLDCSFTFLIPSAIPRHSAFQLRIADPRHGATKKQETPPPSLGLDSSSMDPISRELLNHYTLATYHTLPVKTPENWRYIIPELAVKNPFLMHGLIAISALHLSTLAPSRASELTVFASKREQLALPLFREALLSQDPESYLAVFIFASFVVPYILASSESSGVSVSRIPSHSETHPHWFHALKGVMMLVCQNWKLIAKGPLGPILLTGIMPIEYEKNPDDHHLANIENILTVGPSLQKSEMRACKAALNRLRRLSAHAMSNTVGVYGVIFIWPSELSEEFLQLMYDRRPEALIILAHYCVLLKKINSCWYLKGLGENLLKSIREALTPEWWPWIQWATDYPVGTERC